MAERSQGREEPEESATQWSHDWHSYTDYVNVHHNYMAALLRWGAVLRDGLSFIETRDGKELLQVRIHGRIECRDGVLVVVDKYLDVRRGRQQRYEVKGVLYAYQAWFRDSERTIIRYDTAHGGIADIHCHRRNPSSGRLVREDMPIATLPTLTDFIIEALALADRLGS